MNLVEHVSRPFNPVINFPTTENNLTWSFAEEGDGEIYEIITTNVATLTIAGNSVTLPFVGSIVVTNGNSYSVVITKTTNGQTASVAIKSRRVSKKVQTISVPDYGQFTGNYTYTLHGAENKLIKTQSYLLKPDNLGNNTYTINPILTEITLPTATIAGYSNFAYKKIFFNNSLNCIICIANDVVTASGNIGNIFVCKVDVTSGIVYDLLGNLNLLTKSVFGTLPISSATYGIMGYSFDYIRQIAYIHINVLANYSGNDDACVYLDFNIQTINKLQKDVQGQMSAGYTYLNPIKGIFATAKCEADFYNNKYLTPFGFYSGKNDCTRWICGYDINANRYIVSNVAGRGIAIYNADGTMYFNGGSYIPFNAAKRLLLLRFNNKLYSFSCNNSNASYLLHFGLMNYQNFKFASNQLVTTTTGHTGIIIGYPSNSAGIFITQGGGTGEGLKRLDVFDPTTTDNLSADTTTINAQKGYLILPYAITDITTNQLLS